LSDVRDALALDVFVFVSSAAITCRRRRLLLEIVFDDVALALSTVLETPSSFFLSESHVFAPMPIFVRLNFFTFFFLC